MSELELIAARDHDAMARFYDRHAAMVGQFCAAVCSKDRIDEAVTGVFLNFLALAAQAPEEAEPDELLRRATREVAASRMETRPAPANEQDDPVCRAMPELLAARVNGELAGREGPVVDHLSRCELCQATAARLGQAEVTPPGGPTGEATEGRAAWLRLAGNECEDADALPLVGVSDVGPEALRLDATTGEGAEAGEPTATAIAESPQDSVAAQAIQRQPPQPQVHVGARRGGLVGAVRRFAASQGHDESGDPRRGS